MIKKLLTSVLAMLLFVGMAYAQVTVTGTVKDASGPVLGVSVILKGTTKGVTTDAKGNFTISVPNAQTGVLEFKFVGLESLEYPLNGKTSNLEIIMTESAAQIEDVVVIGYGTSRRADLTGSVASVSAKAIASVPVASAAQALVGRMAGVQITTSDGSPDAEIKVRVRGGGSITQDNSPLYIVDGFQVGSINDIPPTDIESIDVLKDASATAIYGARGANGVVIVTTKSAKAGKTTVNFNAYIQSRYLSKKLDVMNPYEFVLLNYELESLKGSSQQTGFIKNYGDPEDYYIYKGQEGYDWQEDMFGGSSLAQYYNASIGGGGEKTRFNLSFTHNNDEGVQVGTSYQRTNLNFKLNHEIFKNLKIEYNTRFAQKINNGTGLGVTGALQYKPTNGLRDYSYLPPEDVDLEDEQQYQIIPPSSQAEQNYRKQTSYNFNMTGAVNWEIIKGLTYRTEFGMDYNFSEENRFYGPESGTAKNGYNSLPLIDIKRGRSPKIRWANTLNYDFTVKDDHNFNVLVGQEIISSKSFSNYYRVSDLPKDITAEKALANATLGSPNKTESSESGYDRTASFFGRLNYNYKSKYFLTATLRADGSSIFAPGNQWGYFPAGAIAWRISNEEFLKRSRVISNLKLRVSYGAAGNNRIDADLWRRTYKASLSKPVAFGGVDQQAYLPASSMMVNPNIKWETTYTRNLGLDFGFFKDRLSGTIDAYWNTTKDLLVPSSIPAYTGYTEIQTNVGQTSNKGVELTLNGYIVEKKDFNLNMTFNIGYNKNKVDKLSSGEKVWMRKSGWASTDLREQEDFRMEVGQTMGLMYGYVTDGFYAVEDFDYDPVKKSYTLKPGIANSAGVLMTTLQPGSLKLKKLSGEGTDINMEEDRTVIGNANPKFSGGFGVNMNWKAFDFSVFFTYMYGFDVYNANKIRTTTRWNSSQNNMLSIMDSKNRFRYFDDNGIDLRDDPLALAEFNKAATIWSPNIGRPIVHSWAIEDGSFLRLSTATLGYTVPARYSRKAGINNLRIYVTGYNLFCWTKYSGYDPEVKIQEGLTPNVDNNIYPRNRSFTVGLNVTF